MQFIIDGNNLAGKLGIIGEENFDRKLITQLHEYYLHKGIAVTIVFDGHAIMGDRYSKGNIKIIYAPRDSMYNCADDLIVELAAKRMEEQRLNSYRREEIVLVTDDREIKDRLKDVIDNKFLKIYSATELARSIIGVTEDGVDDVDGRRNLGAEEIEKINSDLVKLWK